MVCLSIVNVIILHLLHTRLYVMYLFVHVVVYNPCLSNPCQNQGLCSNSTEGFECTCSGNYEGITCSGRYYAVPVCIRYTFQIEKVPRMCSRGCAITWMHSLTHKNTKCLWHSNSYYKRVIVFMNTILTQ